MKTFTPTELRRIDALMAEHCFAMKKNIRMLGSTETITGYTDNPHFIDCGHTKDYINRYCKPREYTTDPAAAMEVLKWCDTKLAFGLLIQQGASGWNVCIGINGGKNAIAPTLELAICLFALKLNGVEV